MGSRMDHPALDQRVGTVGANPPCCFRTATHLVTHSYRYSRKRRQQATSTDILKIEAGSAHCCFFAASIGVNAAVNTRAGTSLPVDKGACGPILFRASACGRKPFGRYFSEPDMVGRDGHAAHHRRLQLAVLNSSRRRPDSVAVDAGRIEPGSTGQIPVYQGKELGIL